MLSFNSDPDLELIKQQNYTWFYRNGLKTESNRKRYRNLWERNYSTKHSSKFTEGEKAGCSVWLRYHKWRHQLRLQHCTSSLWLPFLNRTIINYFIKSCLGWTLYISNMFGYHGVKIAWNYTLIIVLWLLYELLTIHLSNSALWVILRTWR